MNSNLAPKLDGLYGQSLYQEMLDNFDFSQITWTMTRYNKEMTTEEAKELLHAFLQWFALIPTNNSGHYVIMLETPVEEAFHAFVLNTALYQKFCEQFLGFFFHHTPLREETGPQIEAAVRYTVELLEQHYGENLHPALQRWREQLDAGTYKVACVGPGGHCPVP